LKRGGAIHHGCILLGLKHQDSKRANEGSADDASSGEFALTVMIETIKKDPLSFLLATSCLHEPHLSLPKTSAIVLDCGECLVCY